MGRTMRYLLLVGALIALMGQAHAQGLELETVGDLRAACHCASCIDEGTSQQLLDPNSIPADIHFKSFTKVGNYGIKFNWSDGHNTGIYSYESLRDLAAGQPAG